MTARRSAPRLWLARTLAPCLLALALLGCEEDVTAVLGTDYPYTLYGVLSPQLDSQWVRVYPVHGRLEPEPPAPLDAVFRSVDLQTDEEHVWRDSLVYDLDGHPAHVFWAPFRAAHGHTYRLIVERSDGAASTVETAVPPQTEVVELEPAGPAVARILIAGGAPHLLGVEVEYTVDYRLFGLEGAPEGRLAIAYDERAVPSPEGWVIPVDLRRDYRTLVDTLVARGKRPVDATYGVLLRNVSLRLIVANDAWDPPPGGFDPDVLVQPGVMTNVVNGFGYVVAGHRVRHDWVPPAEVVRAAGFRPLTGTGGAP